MRLTDILKETSVISEIKGTTKEEILAELAGQLKVTGLVKDVDSIVKVIMEREALGSTGIGDGVAIPHGKMKGAGGVLVVFGRSRQGVDFDAVDGQPVHMFFLVLAPEDSASLHLKVLSRISKILRDPSFRKKLLKLPDAHSLYESIVEEDGKL
ncbi:MAG: PTS system fructose-specific EIIABC component [Syntrophorhabdus sp. PtaB.Bin047]|nr:MAG: PTS system fructose-specific EIIABC component [Syntrophorhabdus sp. PtaB.Bin047]